MVYNGRWLLGVFLFLLVSMGVLRWVRPPRGRRRRGPPRMWQWRPRSPLDCALCRAAPHPPLADRSLPAPWRASAGRRGAPRQVATAGYACPSPTCLYRGIIDAQIHALVGDGHHGTTDRIQHFRCQACGTKVSARRTTAL